MSTTPPRRFLLLSLTIAIAVAGITATAIAAMRSERIDDRLCQTTGGGRFVEIPGFPGEKIDRRLKRDIRWMVRRYDIFITDGYSTDPVHSAKGEHPIGLALDIVPNTAEGGNWRRIGRLARWAEPKQDQPRPPFRWVGYNGDPNHGRGHHLHLSWNHSPAEFGKPARTVFTVRCPGKKGDGAEPEPPAEQPGGGGDAGGGTDVSGSGGKRKGGGGGSTGGVSPDGSAGSGGGSGGISPRAMSRLFSPQAAASSVEAAGVDGP